MKKIVVEKPTYPEKEEEKDFPHLIQPRPQTSLQPRDNTAAWNLITTDKIKKGEEQKEPKKEKITPYIDK